MKGYRTIVLFVIMIFVLFAPVSYGAEPKRVAGDPCSSDLKAHSDGVTFLVFSPDSKLLASGSASFEQLIKIWEIPSGRLLRILKFPRGNGHIDAITFNNEGNLIAGAKRNIIKIWDIKANKLINTVHTNGSNITFNGLSKNPIAFHPKQPILAAAIADGTIEIWDFEKNQFELLIYGHSYRPSSVSFSPDGKFLLTASQGSIKIWKYPSGEQYQVIENPDDWAFFSNDGSRFISGTNAAFHLWDFPECKLDKEVIISSKKRIRSVSFCSAGNLLALGDSFRGGHLIDLNTGLVMFEFEDFHSGSLSVAISGNKNYIATAGHRGDSSIRLWRIPEMNCLSKLSDPTDRMIKTSISGDMVIYQWKTYQILVPAIR